MCRSSPSTVPTGTFTAPVGGQWATLPIATGAYRRRTTSQIAPKATSMAEADGSHEVISRDEAGRILQRSGVLGW